jgi:hypothetical protein
MQPNTPSNWIVRKQQQSKLASSSTFESVRHLRVCRHLLFRPASLELRTKPDLFPMVLANFPPSVSSSRGTIRSNHSYLSLFGTYTSPCAAGTQKQSLIGRGTDYLSIMSLRQYTNMFSMNYKPASPRSPRKRSRNGAPYMVLVVFDETDKEEQGSPIR